MLGSGQTRKNEPFSHPIYTPLHFQSHTRKLLAGDTGQMRVQKTTVLLHRGLIDIDFFFAITANKTMASIRIIRLRQINPNFA